MNIAEYESQFDDILEGRNQNEPYDSEEYQHHVKMNQRRIRRWYRKATLLPELKELISNIPSQMHWLLITEPWCGDAAHSHPFIAQLAALNPKIILKVQNRDAPNSEINNYLTNGTKSIPKLVVRDASGRDLFAWGPRPKEAQDQYIALRQELSSMIDIQKELQSWYNKNKGVDMQQEIFELFNNAWS